MVFKDTATKTGLIEDCELLLFGEYGKISGNTDLLYTFTNLLNRQYDKAITLIIENDGRWQADDTSYTTTMVNTTSIVSGQWAYGQDANHLKYLRIRVKDSAGTWHTLTATDLTDSEYPDFGSASDTGLPTHYDKQGDLLMLYPTPNYSQNASLEVTVQRVPNYFAYDDTTKEAGIAPVFHRFLSLGAALDYAIVNSLQSKNDIATLFNDERTRMEAFYSRRNRGERDRLLAAQQNNK